MYMPHFFHPFIHSSVDHTEANIVTIVKIHAVLFHFYGLEYSVASGGGGSRHRSPWLQFYLRCFQLWWHQPKYLTSLMFRCGICKMQNSSTLGPWDCCEAKWDNGTLSLHSNYKENTTSYSQKQLFVSSPSWQLPVKYHRIVLCVTHRGRIIHLTV